MNESGWLILGFAGQACFFGRFLLQWIHSERHKKSLVPVGFWYLSLAGAAIVLVYAIHRRDPVFIVGQTTGAIVYLRNLRLIHLENLRNRLSAADDAAGETTDGARQPRQRN